MVLYLIARHYLEEILGIAYVNTENVYAYRLHVIKTWTTIYSNVKPAIYYISYPVQLSEKLVTHSGSRLTINKTTHILVFACVCDDVKALE